MLVILKSSVGNGQSAFLEYLEVERTDVISSGSHFDNILLSEDPPLHNYLVNKISVISFPYTVGTCFRNHHAS